MAENMQVDGVQSRQAVFVRYCLKTARNCKGNAYNKKQPSEKTDSR